MRLPPRSKTIDVDDSLGEGARGFLRQIVPHATLDDPVGILAREFLRIGSRIGVWCAVGIAFQGDGRHGDDRTFGQRLFQIVILRFTLSQAEPPAVVMDHDAHVIRIVERRGAAIERGICEGPFRRRDLPNQLRKVTPVLFVAGPAALRREVKLVHHCSSALGGNGI